MIKEILKNALNQMKNEENQAINNAVSKNRSDVVLPRFAEIETAKAKAIAEVQASANKQIADLTTEANDSKTKFEAEQKAVATAAVEAEYATAIADLQKQIGEE